MLKHLLIAAAISVAAVSSAGAADLNAPVTQLDGKPLLDGRGNPDPKTLGKIVEDTLLITEATTTPAEKNRRFWIAFKVHEAMVKAGPFPTEYKFTPEEIVEIKTVLEKYQSTLVAWQAIRLLDPTAVPK